MNGPPQLRELSSRFSAIGIRDLEVLSEHSGLVFCRGWRDSGESKRDSVLVVRPASEQPTSATLKRLTHESFLENQLDSAWAVRPLHLLRDRGQTILVLEDPGGELLGGLLGTRIVELELRRTWIFRTGDYSAWSDQPDVECGEYGE